MTSPPLASPPVLLYDGLCSFCDGTVQFVMRHEREVRIRFAPLQGEYAHRLLERYPWLHQVDSLIIVERIDGAERIHARSAAALRLAELIGGWWTLLTIFRVVPRAIRDWAYDLFARNRFRMFGKLQACRVPSEEQRNRFLP